MQLLRRTNRFLTSYAQNIYSPEILKKIQNIKIVDSTLREGEQFINCNIYTEEKLRIADYLCKMRIDYIEVTSPVVSKSSCEDCKRIVASKYGNTRILTHVRCHNDDIGKALECGVDGINMYMATSDILSKYSHKKGIDEIINIATNIIQDIRRYNKDIELRFSCEDSFRSNIDDIIMIYKGVISAGVNRIGIADTVGISDSYIVSQLLQNVVKSLPANTDIEFHCHNDTGSANENAFTALRYGATHIDTTVLGIGERNGITQLGAFLAKMTACESALEITGQKYNLQVLKELESYVANICSIQIPFNNPITGTAFTHKAGVHSNAAINNPNSYEILKPEIFGAERNICVASKLTGKNAIKQRAQDLRINISEATLIIVTRTIKDLFDTREPNMDLVDNILYNNRELHKNSIVLTNIKNPYKIIKLIGHLFDTNIINNIADICTRYNVTNYEIESFPGIKDNLYSTAFIRIECRNNTGVQIVLNYITEYIQTKKNKNQILKFEIINI